MGAMAIEVATLRPIFPGNNEIDQLWRVTEVMGTPSDWHTTDERTGRKVKIGGGPWSHGLKLAAALSFKFPQVCLSLAHPTFAHTPLERYKGQRLMVGPADRDDYYFDGAVATEFV